MVDIIDFTFAVPEVNQRFQNAENVFLAERADCVIAFQLQADVHFHTANGGKVITFRIEEKTVEHSFGSLNCGGLARPHHAVNVYEGFFAVVGLVDHQGIANEGTCVDVINIKDRQFSQAELFQFLKQFFVNFSACFSDDLAGFHINDFFSQVMGVELFIGVEKIFQPIFSHFISLTGSDFLTRLESDLAVLGVDQIICWFNGFKAFRHEGCAPTFFAKRVDDLVIEDVQDFFIIMAKRV